LGGLGFWTLQAEKVRERERKKVGEEKGFYRVLVATVGRRESVDVCLSTWHINVHVGSSLICCTAVDWAWARL